jgi:rhodanese-related sulfurtransferase
MTGQRSQLVAAKLRRAGFQVWNLRGGLIDWQARHLPLDTRPLRPSFGEKEAP